MRLANVRMTVLMLTLGGLAPVGAEAADAVPPANTAGVDADTAGSIDKSLFDAGDPARLTRAFEKSIRGEAVRLAFLGGSITQGSTTTEKKFRYVNRITDWWQQQFPDTAVAMTNAGIGATGSHYGALRVKRDVLSKKPDVVFVEYAVNDANDERSARTLEGVVRQVLSDPRGPACVLLFMSQSGRNVQDWHAKVGRHYGLPMVSYRDGLASEIDAGRLNWKDVGADAIHPNDRGHAMAARYVTAMLSKQLEAHRAAATAKPPVQALASPAIVAELPAPLFSDLYANVELQEANTLRPTRADGWAYDKATSSWKADQPGSVIEFKTTGRGAALMYYRIRKDFGRVRVTIDGQHAQTVDGWFAEKWGGYRHTTDLATDLRPGEHTVRVELLTERAEQSGGNEFRIMGLASLGVGGEQKDTRD